MVVKTWLWMLLVLLAAALPLQAQQFITQEGKAHFVSEAPLELIEAQSEELRGALDVSANTFAFAIPVQSFKGFNSPLQQEHFNENYMESKRFPRAIFKGKIVDDVDLRRPGTYQVRAKGLLQIHGVEQERIIPVTIVVALEQIQATASFNVLLADHNISIPKLVYQKIADNIRVDVQAQLSPAR